MSSVRRDFVVELILISKIHQARQRVVSNNIRSLNCNFELNFTKLRQKLWNNKEVYSYRCVDKSNDSELFVSGKDVEIQYDQRGYSSLNQKCSIRFFKQNWKL